MNSAYDGSPMTAPGANSHANHVAYPDSAVPPPHGADLVDGFTPSWDPWIDIGGEG
jgi:hypothetical protein